jgi:hypothetical protein
MAAVDVPAARVRRERADPPGLVDRHAHRPEARLERTSTPGATLAVRPFRRSNVFKNASGKSLARRPSSGITAVQPHSPG